MTKEKRVQKVLDLNVKPTVEQRLSILEELAAELAIQVRQISNVIHNLPDHKK